MAILQAGFVAILMVCAASASQPLESARDQYKAHEDQSHPPQLLSEATDLAGSAHQPVDIVPIIKNEDNKQSKVYNKLRSAAEKPKAESENIHQTKTDQQKVEEQRLRRSISASGLISFGANYYNPWIPSVATIVDVPPISSYSLWQPQYYQIRRPYFIPVWGSPGKTPLYFPPQPLYVNTGYPVDNPPREYLPPNNGYLPPDPNTSTSAPYNSTLMPTINKFGDGPVWGTVSNSDGDSNRVPTTTTIIPTRRTRRPGQGTTTQPPLVHKDSPPAGNQLSVATTTPRPFSSGQRPARPTQRPAPPTQRPAPPTQRPAPPTQRPASAEAQPANVRQPSRCVWAIVSCCSTSSQDVSYRCFEQLGCTGAFWDASPCESEFARAAIANVMQYYNTQ